MSKSLVIAGLEEEAAAVGLCISKDGPTAYRISEKTTKEYWNVVGERALKAFIDGYTSGVAKSSTAK